MHQLALHRVDYAQVGTTNRRCIRLLPVSGPPPALQRVVAGSQLGEVICFHRKKGTNQVIFQTLPGPKIECVSLGGALGMVQDKIFYASEHIVKGFSKKGKQFFNFETNMTESITAMFIYGVDMFLCGATSMNHYHDCNDAHHYQCTDRINDVICLPVLEGSWVGRGLTPVLACDDRSIKVISGSDLSYQVVVGGIPTVLKLWNNNGGPDGTLVVYGCRDGKIGLVSLPIRVGSVKWEIDTSTSGTVTALCCYNLSKTGVMDLIVGKDDGFMDIYTIDETDKVQLLQTVHCDESITGLDAGKVSSDIYDEIVISTYTGWIYSMTTEPKKDERSSVNQSRVSSKSNTLTYSDANTKPERSISDTTAPTLSDPNQESTVAVADNQPEEDEQVRKMRAEVEELQNRVAVERERYHEQTSQEQGSGLSAVPVFAINDRFVLMREDAAYMLTIELVVPIDYVMLQCDVSVDLLDVEKNSAVVSLTDCDPNCGNALLATYRCQANTTKLDIKVRSIEGQYGNLLAYISPKTHPKICQIYKVITSSKCQREADENHLYDTRVMVID